MTDLHDRLDTAFRDHGTGLWQLAYRMTGVAADADEILQETWIRALERPPADLDRPLRPWLVRVAANLARDRLRRRKRIDYVGPWLPAPVDDSTPAPDLHHARREACSYAWLVAAEALTPNQRAVLLLREVCDLSVRETAQALDLSDSNVKVTLHRARRKLGVIPVQPSLTHAQQEQLLGQFADLMALLATGQVDAARQAMADQPVLLSDGAGEYAAARVPVVGVDRITRFFHGIARHGTDGMSWDLRMVGGLPAMVFRRSVLHHRSDPPAGVTMMQQRNGRVHRIYSVLASRKLAGVVLPEPG